VGELDQLVDIRQGIAGGLPGAELLASNIDGIRPASNRRTADGYIPGRSQELDACGRQFSQMSMPSSLVIR
jgi:hypothetical protein